MLEKIKDVGDGYTHAFCSVEGLACFVREYATKYHVQSSAGGYYLRKFGDDFELSNRVRGDLYLELS